MPVKAPGPQAARRWGLWLWLLAGLGALAVAGWSVSWLSSGAFRGFGTAATRSGGLDPAEARRSVQWIDVAYADAARSLGTRAGIVVHYQTEIRSPCAGGEAIGGPFYCPRDRTAAFDTGFTVALARRLRGDADRGTALMAGQIAAVQLQAETGLLAPLEAATQVRLRDTGARARALALALHADCLTGLWAARAGASLGEVTPDLYRRMVEAERALVTERRLDPSRLELGYDLIGAGRLEARARAFGRGMSAADPEVCLLPQLD